MDLERGNLILDEAKMLVDVVFGCVVQTEGL